MATAGLVLTALAVWGILRLYQALGFYVPAGRLGRTMPRLILFTFLLGAVATAAALLVEGEQGPEPPLSQRRLVPAGE
jgi:vacuolar-type H+-ATPase subunit I/STV1